MFLRLRWCHQVLTVCMLSVRVWERNECRLFTNLGAEVNERIEHKLYLKTEFDNEFVLVHSTKGEILQ